MNSQQLFDAIINGDVNLMGFQAWLHEAAQEAYIGGYSDGTQEQSKENK